MEAKRLVQFCFAHAANRKGKNPKILDLRKVSSVTDYFLIITGTSARHLKAIASEILLHLKKDHGIVPYHIDGNVETGWMVIDFHDVIVHAMTEKMRARYDLESLWGDAPDLRPRRPKGMGKRSLTKEIKDQDQNQNQKIRI